MNCDICGKSSSNHLTEISNGKVAQHHYCNDHLPNKLKRTPAEELKAIENAIAALDDHVMSPESKAEFRKHFEERAREIKSHVSRPGDNL